MKSLFKRKSETNLVALQNIVQRIRESGTSFDNNGNYKRIVKAMAELCVLLDDDSGTVISIQNMLQSEVCEVCATLLLAVTPQDVTLYADIIEMALWVISKACEIGHDYVTVYHIPGVRDSTARMAMLGVPVALTLYWNFSDKEVLAYEVVTYPGYVVATVNLMNGQDNDKILSSLSAIRNLSMFAAAQPELMKNKTIIDVLVKLSNRVNTKNSADMSSTKATMALANLIGKDEIQSELLRTNDKTLAQICALLEGAMSGENMFALYEPLLSLRYLVIPLKNRVLMKDTLLPLLPRALSIAVSKDDVRSAGYTVTILSHYAFDEIPREKFKADVGMITMIESIVNMAKTKSAWTSVGHEAQGLLWTIRGSGDSIDEYMLAGMTPSKPAQVMISYNWAHKDLALRVAGFLRNNGFTVWQDVVNMSSNLMESMATAILTSNVVVMLVTPQYKESANCQREATFAVNRKKKIVPLIAEAGYQGDGWLGVLLAPLLYFDITTDFEGVMKDMVAKEMRGNVVVSKGGGASHQEDVIVNESIADVAEYIGNTKGLENLRDTFTRHMIDGEIARQLTRDWQTGKITHDEVMKWFGISTVGQLFALKSAMKGRWQ